MNLVALAGAVLTLVSTPQDLFIKADSWINAAAPITRANTTGKTVLLAFVYTECCSFQSGADALRDLNKRFAKNGLVIVGIHQPSEGLSLEWVSKTYGFTFPLASDKDGQTKSAYLPANGGFVTGAPRYVLFTPDGKSQRLESTGEMKTAIEARFR